MTRELPDAVMQTAGDIRALCPVEELITSAELHQENAELRAQRAALIVMLLFAVGFGIAMLCLRP